MPIVQSISPTQSDAQAAMLAFLADVTGLPNGQIIASSPNRVPEPKATNFIIINPLRMERVSTNTDATNDVRFVGSIAGTALSISSITFGTIYVGLPVIGPNILPGTMITAGSGFSWTVNFPQTVASQVMSGGTTLMTETYIMTMQLDFHSSANDYTAFAQAQTVATAYRDFYATNFFANLPGVEGTISPLYCEDAMHIPFINDQQQYESRWVLDVKMQLDQVVSVPQTYDDSISLSLYFVP